MPSFDVDPERLYVFCIDDEYLFSEYFEHQDLFDRLSDYYNGDAYRFEVPAADYDDVVDALAEFYYQPVEVDGDERADFCVVTGKYDQHAEILRQSVLQWERQGHRFFLMKSPLAVDEAIERGATPLSETEFVLGLWGTTCPCRYQRNNRHPPTLRLEFSRIGRTKIPIPRLQHLLLSYLPNRVS